MVLKYKKQKAKRNQINKNVCKTHTKKIFENLSEYEVLRNEIISTQASRTNYIVYMYSIYVALLAGAIQWNRYFIIITFVILISFQAKILRTKEMIVRLSSFIRIFFEEERDDMHWELALKSDVVDKLIKESNDTFMSKLSGGSSEQLGFVSLIFYILLTINEYLQIIYSYNSYISICIFFREGALYVLIDLISIALMIYFMYVLHDMNDKYRHFNNDKIDACFRKYKVKLKKQL